MREHNYSLRKAPNKGVRAILREAWGLNSQVPAIQDSISHDVSIVQASNREEGLLCTRMSFRYLTGQLYWEQTSFMFTRVSLGSRIDNAVPIQLTQPTLLFERWNSIVPPHRWSLVIPYSLLSTIAAVFLL